MVKVKVSHTLATLVKLNEFLEIDETTVDLKGKKTKQQIERMFKGCKVKTMQVITDTCRVPLETLLQYREDIQGEPDNVQEVYAENEF